MVIRPGRASWHQLLLARRDTKTQSGSTVLPRRVRADRQWMFLKNVVALGLVVSGLMVLDRNGDTTPLLRG